MFVSKVFSHAEKLSLPRNVWSQVDQYLAARAGWAMVIQPGWSMACVSEYGAHGYDYLGSPRLVMLRDYDASEVRALTLVEQREFRGCDVAARALRLMAEAKAGFAIPRWENHVIAHMASRDRTHGVRLKWYRDMRVALDRGLGVNTHIALRRWAQANRKWWPEHVTQAYVNSATQALTP